MKIRFLWKDGESGINGCPSVYAADGGYVVQGVVLDDETRAQLRNLAADEDAVFVPANVLDRLAARRPPVLERLTAGVGVAEVLP